MSCCGKGREQVRVIGSARRAPAPQGPAPSREPVGVTLRYLGASAILVRGPVTQRAYSCAPGQTTLVDARDSAALVRTQLFRSESGARR
jgi:hypothetical protein